MPYFFSFMKKYLLLCQYFVKKRPHSKTQTAIQFFYNKFPTIMLIFHQKMLILLKLHNVLGHQSQKNAFFLSFHEKITSLSLISKKHPALKPIFYHENVDSLKYTVLLCCFFSQIWYGKPLGFKPIFGQKTSILSKLLYILGP